MSDIEIARNTKLNSILDVANTLNINEDELVEITPTSVRLRKKILDTNERKKFDKRKKYAEQ